MNELEALLILTHVPYLGSIKIRGLIKRYASAAQALQAPLSEIETLPGFGPKIVEGWKKSVEREFWKRDLFIANQLGAELIPFTSPRYPQQLLEIADYPLILYVQGDLFAENRRSLAIVGTRNATVYGMEMARKLAKDLARSGYTIVSGLARGIDTAAHESALEEGRTIGVLGSGLASVYPKENGALARNMQKRGAVISEFPMETPPDRHNFPRRNRIVSGMTMGTILVEAPLKSGALITVERAAMQGRPVFVLPGRADGDSFKGNHWLIKQRKAELIECAGDVLAFFGEDILQDSTKRMEKTSLFPLENEEEELLHRMPGEECSVEELITKMQWPVAKLNGLLMGLVLKQRVKEFPGKIYKKKEYHG